MRVLSVEFQNVGVHDKRTLNLADTGTVVVTGANGSGKSSFVEGVALALWGESLRGEPLWREGQQGVVTVEVGIGQTKLIVVRKRTKAGAKSLTWFWSGEEPTKYETPTKAQEALEAIVGTFDVWRRTSVLSSADSAHFSLATDAERKRLLERVLGLDRLDIAADAARADQRKLDQQIALAQQDARNLQGHLATAKARVQEATDSLAALGAAEPDAEVDAVALKKKLALAEDEHGEAQQELNDLRDEVARAKAGADEASRRCQRLAHDNCPTCAQPIPTTMRTRLESDARVAMQEVEALSTRLTTRSKMLKDTLAELADEVGQLRDALSRSAKSKRHNDQMATLRATLDKQLADAQTAVKKASADAKAAADKTEKLTGEVAVQKAVTEVFGFKGVRAHLLDKALRQVERVANRHLSVLGNGMSIALTSTTEKKTGGLSDAISLRVKVRGEAARPYASLSGGERRRTDVAVLLALADVAGAVAGKKGATLWMDEVFDALDGDGAAAVGTVVASLAATRAVVLITHADSLVRSLHAAQRVKL